MFLVLLYFNFFLVVIIIRGVYSSCVLKYLWMLLFIFFVIFLHRRLLHIIYIYIYRYTCARVLQIVSRCFFISTFGKKEVFFLPAGRRVRKREKSHESEMRARTILFSCLPLGRALNVKGAKQMSRRRARRPPRRKAKRENPDGRRRESRIIIIV